MNPLFLLLLSLWTCSAKEEQIVATFSGRTLSETFANLARDSESGDLFIGATNALYHLDSRDLSVKDRVRTGPELDSPYCNWDGLDCITPIKRVADKSDPLKTTVKKNDSVKVLTNNVNKVLLTVPDKGVLLACGSLNQGICSVRRLENITRVVPRPQGSDPVPVVANSANGSTVAFLAPGPNKESVLYVGATFTFDAYREAFPAVASRSIQPGAGQFGLVDSASIMGQSGLYIKTNHRADFRVTYVGGFQSEGFAYWAAVQPESLELRAPYTSKLLRVCENDALYESYSEITMECISSENQKFNILQSVHVGKLGLDLVNSLESNEFKDKDNPEDTEFLIGVFAKGEKPGKLQPGAGTGAVCVYPLKQIKSSFWYNIQRCKAGVGFRNLPQFGFNSKCFNMSKVPDDDCQMGRIGGTMPLASFAALIVDGAVLSGVTADVTRAQTLLFLGTTDGRVVKVHLESLTSGRIVNEIQISPLRASVASDLMISQDKRHLFAMAGNEIHKIKVSMCEQHRTCTTCLQSGDPYCGWCTLENKCSSRNACPQREVEYGWIPWSSDGEGNCPRLLSPLTPGNASIAVEMQATVSIHLSQLPPPGPDGLYQCVFGDSSYLQAEFIPPATLQCHFPPFESRPKLTEPFKDHWTIPLKLWSSRSSKIFHEEPFIFYDCGAHNLCTSCVSSQWSCHWCLMENRCVHDVNSCFNKTAANGDSKCPHIDKDLLLGREILLSDGHSEEIRLPVSNLESLSAQNPSPISLDALECVIQVEERTLRSKGRLGADGWVTCASRTYTYEASEPSVVADLYLSGGGSLVIDKIKVEIYKCNELSSDCSSCLTMDPRYMCTWCAGSCTLRDSCPIGSVPSEEIPKVVCPAPVIYKVEPLMGPLQGGTEITIYGKDLGTSLDEVNQRILIANTVPCVVKEYIISKKIVCITQSVRSPVSGPITIDLGQNKKGKSEEVFQFLSPSLHSIYPTLGPESGGTELTISGSNLQVGSIVRVWLGSNLVCPLSKSTEHGVVCITPKSPQSGWVADEIRVQVDRANLTLRKSFHYTPDPKIFSVEPAVSFRSGGRRLLVRGTSLNTTLEPKIFLIDPIKLRERKHIQQSEDEDVTEEDTQPTNLPPLASKLASCIAENATAMWCRSPTLLGNPVRKRRDADPAADISTYPKWPLGFQMDGVKEVQLLPNTQLTIVPDPEYFKFPGGRKLYRGDREPLILEGRYLSLGSHLNDVQVFIGTERCNVTLLAPTQLVCQPPSSQPAASDSKGNAVKGEKPVVTVLVGSNLTFLLGEVAYESAGGFKSSLSQAVMDPAVVGGIVTAAALFLLVIVVCIAVWWRRKSWQAEKEYKRIQLQMDNLESNVRMECKQAFAELQTDMSDLTSDLLALGIPFHTRRTFSAKILFKDEQHQNLLLDWQHSLSNGNGYSSHLHMALAQFESLLWDKQFVLQLVETFERQPNFSGQDRVYVASLLTSALARNMQYCTDVILDLLRQLINKNLESRYPQLMLRRTESVVEKMLSNWIALCLYDYLQEEPGASLFLLFRALKHQVEKGPVDAVTGEARYSLSEDRLLKEQTQAESLILHVIPCVEDGTQDTVPCRVLDVDTISQAKSKILDTLYRNNPYTTRPAISDFDLEWKCSPSGHVVLMDDERGSPSSKDGWKRLNTLHSFNVPNNAVVALIPRSRGSYTYSSSSSHYASINSSTLLIPNGHHSPDNVEQPSRYWHLVRPQTCYLNGASPHLTLGRNRKMMMEAANNTIPKSIPEIYLTRLLTSKGTVQKFVDDFFASALHVSPHSFPVVIKYLFDFFEKEAYEHEVEDPGVVYSWKNNSLPLRFWVNIIKNPDFVFDIEKTSTVDSCLSVVAQTFMDACSPSEPRLGKDSPSNKLLFAKDIPRYREQVAGFYHDIRNLPPVSDQVLNAYMATLSKSYAQEFNVLSAVRELLCYVVKYSEPLLESLDADPRRRRLADRLEQVLGAMSGRVPRNNVHHDEYESENIYAAVR